MFKEQSEVLVQKMGKELHNSGFNIFPYITLCALDIICGKHTLYTFRRARILKHGAILRNRHGHSLGGAGQQKLGLRESYL